MGIFGLEDVPSKCKGMLATTTNGKNGKKHVGEWWETVEPHWGTMDPCKGMAKWHQAIAWTLGKIKRIVGVQRGQWGMVGEYIPPFPITSIWT